MAETLCVIEGCEKPMHNQTHGWCEMHYYRHYRYGSTDVVKRPGRRRIWQDKRSCMRAHESARRAKLKSRFIEHVDPRRVYEIHGGCCGICKEFVGSEDFHVDHIMPLSRGGVHGYVNVQLAHPGCNRKKWATVPATLGGGSDS